MHADLTHSGFNTTSWTLIEALQDSRHPQHAYAMDTMVQRYWPPVYAAVRRMGRDRDAAADATQGFFADVVLARKLFDRAESQKGKLRTLLLTALKRYMIDQHRRDTSRGGDHQLSLTDLIHEDSFLSREASTSVEDVFERRWAVAIMEEAMDRCRRHFLSIDKPLHWEAFDRFSLQPATYGSEVPTLNKIAEELLFPSSVHVASALKVVRKHLQILLREVAAETAIDEDQQEAEYLRMVSLLG